MRNICRTIKDKDERQSLEEDQDKQEQENEGVREARGLEEKQRE